MGIDPAPWSLNVKLGPRHNYREGRAVRDTIIVRDGQSLCYRSPGPIGAAAGQYRGMQLVAFQQT